MESAVQEKTALLMLSGGRDSFLSACRLYKDGYKVNMIVYDNGHTSHLDYAQAVAERIVSLFGEQNANFVGIHKIAQDIPPLMQKAFYSEPCNLYKEYPHILYYQVNCLACHTAMYLHSIAYCKAHNICVLSEGARKQQGFFIELPEMKKRYECLCKSYGITLILPVFDLDSDQERKRELARWGFHPKSYEAQCWMGCPLHGDLNTEQRENLSSYYDREMQPQLDVVIHELQEIKKCQICESHISYCHV